MFKEDFELPQGIIDAYNEDRFAVFIGAGMSRLVGCKGWDSLADELIHRAFNFAETQQFCNTNLSSKEKITIALHQFKKDNNEDVFNDIMQNVLKKDENKTDIYAKITRLKCIFLTTNADMHLEKHMKDLFTTDCSIETIDNQKSPFLYYLHGRLGDNTEADRKTLVFTVDRYLERYNDNNYIEFLRHIFNKYTVLFLGYGLNEFELMDHLFTKVQPIAPQKHYILEGFCSNMDALREAKMNYYNELGIQMLVYCQDKDGYEAQNRIIDKWVEQLLSRTYYKADVRNELDDIMQEYTESNNERLIYILKELDNDGKPYLTYFLSKIYKYSAYHQYIVHIWNEKIVSASDCPEVKYVDGGYNAPQWDFTCCLFQIMKSTLSKTDNFYEFTANVISEIISKIKTNENAMKNFNVRNDIVGIILYMPNEYITSNMVEFVCTKTYADDFICYNIANSDSCWLTWDNKYVFMVFQFILGYSSDNGEVAANTDDYIIEKMLEKNIDKLTAEQKAYMCTLSIKNITESLKSVRYSLYGSFHSLLQSYSYSYHKKLYNIIKELSTFVSNKKEIKEIIRSANNKPSVQFALVISRLFNFDIEFVESLSPLSYRGTEEDFCKYLDEYGELNNTEQRIIINIINSAEFGISKTANGFEKSVNTRKLNIYEMLKLKSPLFKEQYDRFIQYDHFKIINPLLEPKIVRDNEWETIGKLFKKEELENMSVAQAIMKIRSCEKYPAYKLCIYYYKEIADYCYKNNRITELLSYVNDSNATEIDAYNIILVLGNSKYSRTFCSVDMLQQFKLFIEHAYETDDSETKTDALRALMMILENFIYDYPEELYDLCIRIDDKKLWKGAIDEFIPNKDNLVFDTINSGISMLYTLIVKSLNKLKEKNIKFNEMLKQFKHWFDCRITTNNKHFFYSMAYNFQGLCNLDRIWTESICKELFNNQYKAEMILICFHYVMTLNKSIVEIIFDEDLFKTIYDNKEYSSFDKNRMTEYVVTARFFDMIDDVKYKEFLDYLPENEMKPLFDKTVYEMKCEEDIINTYQIVKGRIRRDDVYTDIMESLESLKISNDETWNIICDCLSKINFMPNNWLEFDELFVNNIDNITKGYLKAFELYTKKFIPRSEEMIFDILKKLSKNDAIRIANNLIDKQLSYTDKVKEFINDVKQSG